MDEAAAFEKFYTEKIEPSLPQLRAECRQADTWGMVGIIAAISGIAVFITYLAGALSGNQAWWLWFFCAVMLVLSVYKYTQRNDRFTADFKAVVIKKIIDEVCPGLVYKPGETITTREYKTSSLYRYRYDYFDGDDLIEGVINNISFRCAELHTQSDYAGNKQVTVFKGLFFVAKINSRFTGGTYVWPRNSAQLPTSMMDSAYRLLPMPRIVDIRFHDAEFDQQFRVCSTWPSQAHEILTPENRSRLLHISKTMNIPMSVSFAAGKCFIGIPIAADLLEPTEYDPGDKEEIRKYFITIQMITNIISQSGLSALQ
jgi:hypothetical protein